MLAPLRVAVVGCGTAGAASALLLSRAGHAVTVFERVPDPGPVGAGIMMQPSGLLVLERLGLAERILARGSRVDHLLCETTGGRAILDLRYASLGDQLYGVGLHRGVLFETLFDGGLEAFKREVVALAPIAAPVLDQVHDFAQLTFASYWDVTMPRWHAHRVVLLGDAAHATSPQLGQGCTMGPASRFSFVRREMVRSMAGTKTGLLFGSMETRMPRK